MLSMLVPHLLDALPARCELCASWPAQPFCAACAGRFARPRHRCRTCALPLPESVPQCGACLSDPPPLDACVAAVNYAYPWSASITRFKFGEQPGLARPLAKLLIARPAACSLIQDCRLLLPMPLSDQRLAERGFNQALELCRHLASGKTRSRLLLRIRHTTPQSLLSREERQRNVRGAFMVAPDEVRRVSGARVVLVDDVMTSGASLRAAALALRQAGATAVSALVIARTDAPGQHDA